MADNNKDIVLAVLGGTVSLAGLLLVFSGFLFSHAGTLPKNTTPTATIRRYERAAKVGVAPFLFCLVLAVAAIWWLLSPGPPLFAFVWMGFIGLIAATAVYGAFVILKYL